MNSATLDYSMEQFLLNTIPWWVTEDELLNRSDHLPISSMFPIHNLPQLRKPTHKPYPLKWSKYTKENIYEKSNIPVGKALD